MNKKFALLIIISIIILSFLFRVYDLGSESVWYDEGYSVYHAEKPILEAINILDQDRYPYYILYDAILHFWIKLFGDSEFSIRFPSVIFGILSIYVIYKLGELIFGTNVGLLASFILSITLYHIRYSQEARSYSLLVLLVLLSNYYLVKILENTERKYIIGYIISSIMMIFAHGYGFFYIIFQNVYYFLQKKRDLKLWAIVQGIIFSTFVLWIPFFLRKIKLNDNILKPPTVDSIFNTFKIYVGSEQILYIYMAIIIIGISIGLINRYDNKNVGRYLFVILWLVIPFIISYTISYTIEPIYHNRYLMASFPALVLLFSKGLSNFKKIPIILSVLLIVLLLQIPLIEGYYHDIKKDQWRETTYYIKNATADNDMILLYPNFTKIPFGYYYKDQNYVGINSSFNTSSVYDKNRIWLIYSHILNNDRRNELNIIEKELSKIYTMKKTTRFYGIKINEYSKKLYN